MNSYYQPNSQSQRARSNDVQPRNETGQNRPTFEIKARRLPTEYVDHAESCIKNAPEMLKITNTKLRNLFSLIVSPFNEMLYHNDPALTKEQMKYLSAARVRLVYECSREEYVQKFVQSSHLLDYLADVGNDRERFINFYHYFEALIAYHRFYGGAK